MTRLPPVPRRGWCAAAALVLAVVAAVGARLVPAPEPPDRSAAGERAPGPVRVMPLGDSITSGIGSATGSSYRAELHRRLTGAGVAVDLVGSQHGGRVPDADHEGHSGWTVGRIAERVEGWLAAYRPDVVLVHIGTNDMRSDAVAGGAGDRLAALLARIRHTRPEAHVLIATLVGARAPAEQRRIDAYNRRVRTVAAAGDDARVHLVEQSSVDGADIRDNLHPNDYGYAKMAFNWFRVMAPLLRVPGTASDNPYLAREAYRCLLRPTYPRGRYEPVYDCRWYRGDRPVAGDRPTDGPVYR